MGEHTGKGHCRAMIVGISFIQVLGTLNPDSLSQKQATARSPTSLIANQSAFLLLRERLLNLVP
jgi:hypothetical protein